MGKMTILLDTHIFLWWLFDDFKLSNGIRAGIERIDNKILVSSASNRFLFPLSTPSWLENGKCRTEIHLTECLQPRQSWNVSTWQQLTVPYLIFQSKF